MRTRINILEDFFAAINRNDLHAVTRDFHPDITRIEPEGFATFGTYRGIDAVREHIRQGRGSWAEGSCDPEGYFENSDKVVVFLHAQVRKQGATEWLGGRFADGFTFRDGRIIEYRTFWERDEAMKWAGIET
ncbi:MAG: nuclear transport factor 2 family protein [Burkholderiales bacterium]|nr:nuclear transport factor 2 family protein [Burkholderiales bacterium]